MTEQDTIISDVQASRENYLQNLEKLVQQKLPGVIKPVAAGCSVGEVCHGGNFRKLQDTVTNPGPAT
ncbi:MAG: hypothetical protein LUQ11_12985 [Methylococcaceae bacterium]|nr:hypothetical protein [Methylococcaceae bacterium]